MNKKTLLFILLVGQTFLWTGSAFMSVLYRLYGFYTPTQAVLFTEVLYYVMQAAGIAAFALFIRRKAIIAGGKLFAALSIVATGVFTALALLCNIGSVVVLSGMLMNLFIGVLSGIYLTRLSTQIPQQYRGRVFGYSYTIGSVGTYLLSLPMSGKLLQSDFALYIFLFLMALSAFLTKYLEPITSDDVESWRTDSARVDKRLVVSALCIPLICSVVYGMGGYFTTADLSNVLSSAFTRAFYAVGLITAGHINDKDRRYGAVCCAAALVFPFVSFALAGEIGISVAISIVSYIFYGFFSVYRVVLFTDIAGKRASLLYLAVFGLMIGRIGDAAGTFVGLTLGGNQILLTCITAAVFIVGMLLFFEMYRKLYMPLPTEKDNTEALLSEYETHYELTSRQCEILRLVLKGCSNAEVSAELFLSESTVKFHMKNILKKTNCTNRTELISDYKTGKRR